MKKGWIAVIVVAGAAVLAGLGVLIWYLVRTENPYDLPPTIELEGSLGDITQRAGFTSISDAGDMFWWMYPSQSQNGPRPTILWLSGVTELPPSLSANIGMFGPFDSNLNRRNDSWVDDYNLLFIDAPLGTGFSTVANEDLIPRNAEENAEHLLDTLQSIYRLQPSLAESPLYIFGQGHGAQMALALALRIQQDEVIAQTLQGVALGNGIIDPGSVLTKLGFYLEELGYIDAPGRQTIEDLATNTQELISAGQLGEAFNEFASLGQAVNEAGAIAVNLHHIVEKLTFLNGTFGEETHLKSALKTEGRLSEFMDAVVAPALGIQSPAFESQRAAVLRAFADSYMTPAISMVEEILQNTELTLTIYNGNLDAVSNTLGQVAWVQNLVWDGQETFLSQPRQLLVLGWQLEGYFRQTDRLRFYWINAAGQSVPLDSPIAMRRVLNSVFN